MNPDSSGAPPLREEVKTLFRDRLLDAAEEVFAARGFAQTRVEDVAARAGVAVGTVYNYFSDRRALLAAVIDRRREGFSHKLREVERTSRGRPFVERLEAFVGGVLEQFDENRRFYPILAQAECSPPPDRQAGGRLSALADAYRRAERLLEGGMAEGAIPRQDAGLLAAALTGMLRGVAFRMLLNPKGAPFAADRDALVALFLRGAQRPR